VKPYLFFLLYVFSNCFTYASSAQQPTQEKAQVSVNDTKIRITDSHGKWAFDSPPKRIAVINWTITEQLLELDVLPVAVADIDGFKKAAPQTLVPSGIVDLRSRSTPDLKKLKTSKPELIIIGYSQRDLMRVLSHIAPVMYFNNFSRRKNNAERADEHFLKMAKLFGKTTFAKQKLAIRDEKIAALKLKLAQHYKMNIPPNISIVNLGEDKSAWLYSTNSMPYYAAQKLGFVQDYPHKPTKLGVQQISTEKLSDFANCTLYLNSTAVQQLSSCSAELATTFSFGGAMSLLYLAESITDGLLTNTLSPSSD